MTKIIKNGKEKIIQKDGKFFYQQEPLSPPPSHAALPPGYYIGDISNGMMGKIISFKPLNSLTMDKSIVVTEQQNEVIDYINRFFSAETRERYKQIGLVWKTGIMLHGIPGTGKTFAVMRVIDTLIKNGCIVLYFPPIQHLGELIASARCGNSNIPVVAIYEDCEDTFIYYDTQLMQLLDGQESVDGFVIIGTTNMLEEIPERIWQRPSRFSKLVEFDYASPDIVQQYLVTKLGSVIDQDDIAKIVTACSQYYLVLDDIKYVALSAYALQREAEEVLAERYSDRKK